MKKLSYFLVFMILSYTVTNAQSSSNVSNYHKEIVKVNKQIQPTSVHIRIPLENINKRIQYWKDYYRKYGDTMRVDKPEAIGSGVIYSNDGFIITNYHVIDESDQDSIYITLSDGSKYLADIVGHDEYSDLALLRIYADNLTPIKFANSDELEVGELTLALGSPLGLSRTLTSGIVSAIGRGEDQIKSDDGNRTLSTYVQTDAAVNPGNSGGGLFNCFGELIGINTAIYSKTGFNVGYAFAIPSNIVKNIADQLVKTGYVNRAYLGIDFKDLTEKSAKDIKYKDKNAIQISEVGNESPAKTAGLAVDDIIYKIDNTLINNSNELKNYMINKKPGDKIKVSFFRNEKYDSLEVTLGTFSSSNDKTDFFANKPSLNVEIKEVNNEIALYKVDILGAADKAGMVEDDVLVSIDNKKILKIDDIKSALENKKPGDKINCQIKRKNEILNKQVLLHSAK